MNLLLVLSLKGSCTLLGYYVLRVILRKSFSHDMRYFWLKISVLNFLIPMRLLKKEYVHIIQQFFKIQVVSIKNQYDYTHDKIYTVYDDSVIKLSQGIVNEVLFIVFWGGVAFSILIFFLLMFNRTRRRLYRNGEAATDGQIMEQLIRAKNDCGIRRRIRLFLTDEDLYYSSCLFSSFIVMRKAELLPEQVLKHELIHIKRRDSFFQVLLYLAICIHWFNPFIYLLRWEMEKECELSCDDRALGNCSEEARAAYSRILVGYAQRKKKTLLGMYLKKDEKQLESRIENIMCKKEKSKRNMVICAVLMAVLFFGSSLTVLAYDQVVSMSAPQYDIEFNEQGEVQFVSDISTSHSNFGIEAQVEGQFYPGGDESDYGYAKQIS